MTTVNPWTPERRAAKTNKILRECERAAGRLGAKGCIIIAFFPTGDGEHVHVLDAGHLVPGRLIDIYKNMVTAHEIMASSPDGSDVAVQ